MTTTKLQTIFPDSEFKSESTKISKCVKDVMFWGKNQVRKENTPFYLVSVISGPSEYSKIINKFKTENDNLYESLYESLYEPLDDFTLVTRKRKPKHKIQHLIQELKPQYQIYKKIKQYIRKNHLDKNRLPTVREMEEIIEDIKKLETSTSIISEINNINEIKDDKIKTAKMRRVIQNYITKMKNSIIDKMYYLKLTSMYPKIQKLDLDDNDLKYTITLSKETYKEKFTGEEYVFIHDTPDFYKDYIKSFGYGYPKYLEVTVTTLTKFAKKIKESKDKSAVKIEINLEDNNLYNFVDLKFDLPSNYKINNHELSFMERYGTDTNYENEYGYGYGLIFVSRDMDFVGIPDPSKMSGSLINIFEGKTLSGSQIVLYNIFYVGNKEVKSLRDIGEFDIANLENLYEDFEKFLTKKFVESKFQFKLNLDILDINLEYPPQYPILYFNASATPTLFREPFYKRYRMYSLYMIINNLRYDKDFYKNITLNYYIFKSFDIYRYYTEHKYCIPKDCQDDQNPETRDPKLNMEMDEFKTKYTDPFLENIGIDKLLGIEKQEGGNIDIYDFIKTNEDTQGIFERCRYVLANKEDIISKNITFDKPESPLSELSIFPDLPSNNDKKIKTLKSLDLEPFFYNEKYHFFIGTGDKKVKLVLNEKLVFNKEYNKKFGKYIKIKNDAFYSIYYYGNIPTFLIKHWCKLDKILIPKEKAFKETDDFIIIFNPPYGSYSFFQEKKRKNINSSILLGYWWKFPFEKQLWEMINNQKYDLSSDDEINNINFSKLKLEYDASYFDNFLKYMGYYDNPIPEFWNHTPVGSYLTNLEKINKAINEYYKHLNTVKNKIIINMKYIIKWLDRPISDDQSISDDNLYNFLENYKIEFQNDIQKEIIKKTLSSYKKVDETRRLMSKYINIEETKKFEIKDKNELNEFLKIVFRRTFPSTFEDFQSKQPHIKPDYIHTIKDFDKTHIDSLKILREKCYDFVQELYGENRKIDKEYVDIFSHYPNAIKESSLHGHVLFDIDNTPQFDKEVHFRRLRDYSLNNIIDTLKVYSNYFNNMSVLNYYSNAKEDNEAYLKNI